jgi:hypothetical protein
MPTTGKRFAAIFIIATILILAGVFLQLYIPGKISAIEYSLNQYGPQNIPGISQASLDWWIINQATFFNPISYVLMAAGIITYIGMFGRSVLTRNKSAKKKNHKNQKQANQHELDKSIEIVKLKNKVTNYEQQLATQRIQINNLKDNMNLLVKLISEKQEQPIITTNSK